MKKLLGLIAVLVQCAAVSAQGHSAMDPVPRGDQFWKQRHEQINQKAAEAGDKAQVVFIGDSITQGWEGEGKEVWARYYAKRNAVNLGIGGDRTQHVLWRLDNGNLKGLKPKAAVVMIGTNNSNGEDNTVDQIAEGIRAIVQKLRDKLPETKVLLVAIFPRSENPTPQRGKILMVNQIIRKMADNKNVFWADFGQKFIGDHGEIPRDLMPDYLHLTAKGYEIWASSIEKQLARMIGDSAVQAESTANATLSGEWVWTMNTPEGMVSAPLTLEVQGDKVSGRFARGENRWLPIENGTLSGNKFKWTVKRDRPDGSIMTYTMSGTVEGDQIKATARTQMDGQEATIEWTAKRK